MKLLAAALIIPVSTSFARLGVKIAHAIPQRGLKLAFGFFLLITSA